MKLSDQTFFFGPLNSYSQDFSGVCSVPNLCFCCGKALDLKDRHATVETRVGTSPYGEDEKLRLIVPYFLCKSCLSHPEPGGPWAIVKLGGFFWIVAGALIVFFDYTIDDTAFLRTLATLDFGNLTGGAILPLLVFAFGMLYLANGIGTFLFSPAVPRGETCVPDEKQLNIGVECSGKTWSRDQLYLRVKIGSPAVARKFAEINPMALGRLPEA